MRHTAAGEPDSKQAINAGSNNCTHTHARAKQFEKARCGATGARPDYENNNEMRRTTAHGTVAPRLLLALQRIGAPTVVLAALQEIPAFGPACARFA